MPLFTLHHERIQEHTPIVPSSPDAGTALQGVLQVGSSGCEGVAHGQRSHVQ